MSDLMTFHVSLAYRICKGGPMGETQTHNTEVAAVGEEEALKLTHARLVRLLQDADIIDHDNELHIVGGSTAPVTEGDLLTELADKLTSQARPPGLDDLLDFVAERTSPVHMARIWYEELGQRDDPSSQARRRMLGALLETVESQEQRLARYEKNMPSWAHGTPEDYDAWLRELTPVDRRLKFYQWIGSLAVGEILDAMRENLGEDPREAQGQHYHRDDVEEVIDLFDPRREGDPAPSALPKGRVKCDIDHHAHTDGMGYLPTCRLDSAE